VLAYGYGIDPHFIAQPANALFWLAAVICGGSVVWGFILISMDGGNVR
jgi:hypothetical protein